MKENIKDVYANLLPKAVCWFICFMIVTTGLLGQTRPPVHKDSSAYASLSQMIPQLENKYHIKFFYNSQWFSGRKFPMALLDLPLDEFILRIKRLTGYTCVSPRNKCYVFVPSELIIYKPPKQDQSSYTVIGNVNEYGKYKKAGFSGKIIDGESEEPLVGAVINIESLKIDATTDKKGNFSLVLPVGEYEVKLQYVGYQDHNIKIKLVGNGNANLELFAKTINIDEVIISSEKAENNVSATQMSIMRLNQKEIKELPLSLGEKDIIKSFTLMPGIQSVGEFGTGFNVRGGTTDQNLILIQYVPIFNSSHVFGLTSCINSDNILDVTLIKGGIPAQFGERVSSIMNIELGSSNTNDFKLKGGIGLLNSRLSFETPFMKKKMFVQVSCRTSYSDWLLKNMPNQDLMNSAANFYDINGLLTYNFNPDNKLTIFGYYSYDRFLYDATIDYIYSNTLASVKWNHVFNKTLSGYLVVGMSKYGYHKNLVDSLQIPDQYKITSTIDYNKFKANLNWIPFEAHNLNMGLDGILYRLNPGTQIPAGPASVMVDPVEQVEKEKAVEMSVYIDDQYTISKNLSIEGGLRFTEYMELGPDSVYIYNPGFPRLIAPITRVLTYRNNQIIENLPRLEPRLSVRYTLNSESSVKLSYNRVNQFINLISNTAAVSPEDVWKLSDPNTNPLQCDQVAAGYFRNFSNNAYETSIEVYYKKLDHIIDYTDGATILMNTQLEQELLDDVGYNYGTELYFKKNSGKLTGWLSYTYSVARQRTTSNFLPEQINNNSYYPSTNDRPNDLVINASYHLTRRLGFSALFTYSTGRPETYPEYSYLVGGYQLVQWSPRNKYRLPDYNRLDLSVTFDDNLRLKRMWKGNWTLSVINVYGRENVYSTFYQESSTSYFRFYKMYIIGRPLPTLTYNFSI